MGRRAGIEPTTLGLQDAPPLPHWATENNVWCIVYKYNNKGLRRAESLLKTLFDIF